MIGAQETSGEYDIVSCSVCGGAHCVNDLMMHFSSFYVFYHIMLSKCGHCGVCHSILSGPSVTVIDCVIMDVLEIIGRLSL